MLYLDGAIEWTHDVLDRLPGGTVRAKRKRNAS